MYTGPLQPFPFRLLASAATISILPPSYLTSLLIIIHVLMIIIITCLEQHLQHSGHGCCGRITKQKGE